MPPIPRWPSNYASLQRPPASLNPTSRRAAWLHWTALVAAFLSIVVAIVWKWGEPGSGVAIILQSMDVALAVFFCFELFTRTGFREKGVSYLQWRWFDYFAIIPVIALGPIVATVAFWPVLICRAIRLADRTFGDLFLQRNALIVVGIVEEEISDRILDKILTRWDAELKRANFGTAMSIALARNQEAVLQRVYAEQLQEGTFAKIAHYTGLQATLEKEERRLFGAVIEMIGSPEVDKAIRDVIGAALARARLSLNEREWRQRVGEALREDPINVKPSTVKASTPKRPTVKRIAVNAS